MQIIHYLKRTKFDPKRMQLDFTDAIHDKCKNYIVGCTYEVCDSCGGRGTTTSHIEPDGGGYTSSEWAEACDGDPDFAEDYFDGVYDRPCPDCGGRNVVPVADWSTNPELEKLVDAEIQAECDYQAEVAAERRMGA